MSKQLCKIDLPESIEDFKKQLNKLKSQQYLLYFFRVRRMGSLLANQYFGQNLNLDQQQMLIRDLNRIFKKKRELLHESQLIDFEDYIEELTQMKQKLQNKKREKVNKAKLTDSRQPNQEKQISIEEFNQKVATVLPSLQEALANIQNRNKKAQDIFKNHSLSPDVQQVCRQKIEKEKQQMASEFNEKMALYMPDFQEGLAKLQNSNNQNYAKLLPYLLSVKNSLNLIQQQVKPTKTQNQLNNKNISINQVNSQTKKKNHKKAKNKQDKLAASSQQLKLPLDNENLQISTKGDESLNNGTYIEKGYVILKKCCEKSLSLARTYLQTQFSQSRSQRLQTLQKDEEKTLLLSNKDSKSHKK